MRPASRKEEIVAVAARLFYEKGYNAVSMRDIARAMGMKAASLYNHISGKQELLSTLVLEVAHDFTRGMEMVMAEEMTAVSKIESIIEQHIEITIGNSEGLAALNNDWMHLEEEDLKEFVKMRDAYEANFRSIIAEGIARGEFQPRHPEVILFSILSTLRTLYLWYKKRGKLDANVLKKDMVAVFLHGIVA
jgi:AcrR family transcriptional regulator